MMFHLSVRFLVFFVLIASCASNQKLNDQDSHELPSEVSEESDESSIDYNNINETWQWSENTLYEELPTSISNINATEFPKIQNASALWKKLNPRRKGTVKIPTERLNGQEYAAPNQNAFKRSWCFRLGYRMANKSPSKFKLTDSCCKVLAESISIAINYDNVCYKCSADLAFHNCLRNVNTTMSKTVGKYYFNVLSPRCYSIEEHEDCKGTICTPLMIISSRVVPKF